MTEPKLSNSESTAKSGGSKKLVIGWREWVALPQLGVEYVKPKIDTGARSSALHAFDLETFFDRGVEKVRFQIHPLQRNNKETIAAEAEVIEHRRITSSNGHCQLRPVIMTDVTLMGLTWPIELTLANRDAMGFRMLLGRQSIRDHFLIDVSRSFLAGRRIIRRKKKKRKKRPSRDAV